MNKTDDNVVRQKRVKRTKDVMNARNANAKGRTGNRCVHTYQNVLEHFRHG